MNFDHDIHLIGWPAVKKLILNQRSSQERGAITPSLEFDKRTPNTENVNLSKDSPFPIIKLCHSSSICDACIFYRRWLLSKLLISINNDGEAHMKANSVSEKQPASFRLYYFAFVCASGMKDSGWDDGNEVGVLLVARV